MYGLKPHHINSINQVFLKYDNVEKVIIYGSRALGNYRLGSDIDLTLKGTIDLSTQFKIENEMDDLLLPYKIDLSIYNNLNDKELLDHIDTYGKVFYQAKAVGVF